MMPQAQRFAALVLLASCSQAISADAVNPAKDIPQATRDILAMYPGTRVYLDQDRVRTIYGAPMTPGATPQHAAESWLDAHSEAFGAERLQLAELWATTVMDGRFTAFAYQQYIDGLPVEYGNVRVLVLNGPVPRVVYASATVTPPPEAGQVRMNLDGETARQIVNAMPLFRPLNQWGEPQLALYQGDGEWTAPAVVWKFVGEDPDPAALQSKTFFVNIETGRLVHVRNEIYHNEISGSVKAWATPGTLPDGANNPPTLQNVPEMRVRIQGGPSAFTSVNGLFTIPNAGSQQVTVGTGTGSAQGYGGNWVNVVPTGSTPLQQTLAVTPPAAATHFILNPQPSEQLTAQANVFIGTTLVHNYFKDRAPGWNVLDTAIVANTGVSGTCNAFFSGSNLTINFYNAGGGCPNTGYSSVIAHEYGHFVVNRRNLGQGGFGEGFSDVTAMLLYDDGVVGRGFSGIGTVLRDPVAANVQFPCPGTGVHQCGQIVGGVWWRMRTNFGNTYGSALGLEKVRDLHVAWTQMTNGGSGTNFINSAHEGTMIEVLTLDDDDGNINNGTPNRDQICPAFAAHSIQCAPLTLIDIQLPGGGAAVPPPRPPLSLGGPHLPPAPPPLLTPGQPFDIPVAVVGISGTPQPGTTRLHYRIPGAASYTSTLLPETSPNQYLATLPAAQCGEYIEFYFSSQASGGQTIVHPVGAPANQFAARALEGATQSIAAHYDFETAAPWSVVNHPSLTTGQWERAIPAGTTYNGQQVQPGAAFGGQRCYVTDNRTGSSVSSYDVDGGPTILTSPRINITGAHVADLTFGYWLYSLNGVLDSLVVDASPDDGVNWTRILTAGNSSGWATARINLLDHIAPSENVRVRFSVSDNPNDSLTEAAVDEVRVTTWQCAAPPCYANCDQSTAAPVLNIDDFLCFINRFAMEDPWANCDGSTTPPVLNVDDFNCFLNAYASGCP
jgi:hypothetical protein